MGMKHCFAVRTGKVCCMDRKSVLRGFSERCGLFRTRGRAQCVSGSFGVIHNRYQSSDDARFGPPHYFHQPYTATSNPCTHPLVGLQMLRFCWRHPSRSPCRLYDTIRIPAIDVVGQDAVRESTPLTVCTRQANIWTHTQPSVQLLLTTFVRVALHER